MTTTTWPSPWPSRQEPSPVLTSPGLPAMDTTRGWRCSGPRECWRPRTSSHTVQVCYIHHPKGYNVENMKMFSSIWYLINFWSSNVLLLPISTLGWIQEWTQSLSWRSPGNFNIFSTTICITIIYPQNNAKMSVTDRMTSAVSKIADACEESARSGETIALTWTEDELPEGVSFKA